MEAKRFLTNLEKMFFIKSPQDMEKERQEARVAAFLSSRLQVLVDDFHKSCEPNNGALLNFVISSEPPFFHLKKEDLSVVRNFVVNLFKKYGWSVKFLDRNYNPVEIDSVEKSVIVNFGPIGK